MEQIFVTEINACLRTPGILDTVCFAIERVLVSKLTDVRDAVDCGVTLPFTKTVSLQPVQKTFFYSTRMHQPSKFSPFRFLRHVRDRNVNNILDRAKFDKPGNILIATEKTSTFSMRSQAFFQDYLVAALKRKNNTLRFIQTPASDVLRQVPLVCIRCGKGPKPVIF